MTKIRDLEVELINGRISRRDFMMRASALGLTASMFGSSLAQSAFAETPAKGGTFRLGLPAGATNDVLDPALLTTTYVNTINMQIRNCLTEIDADFNAIPELAESWDVSPDAKRWTFKLRNGVEFHNGKSLNAEDVVYSINMHRGEDTKSAAKSLVASVEDVKADGKDTVVFTLTGGSADFSSILSDFHLTIVPADTQNFDDGVGTGGYILEAFEPGVRTFVKRNPNYFKPDRAHFDEVESINLTDPAAKVSALVTGSVDAAITIEPKIANQLEEDENVKLVQVTGTQHVALPMLVDVAPFDQNDVRLALKLAIDREQVLRTVLRGRGAIGNDHPIAPIMQFFATDIPQRDYDPDQAKFHLKKAGQENLKVKLHTTDAVLGVGVDVATLYKEHAAKAGIDIEVVREPADGYWASVWLNKPFCVTYWGGRPTADYMFTVAYAADAAWNDTHWKNEHFNRLLVEARAELDNAKRTEMYRDIQLIVRDEGGTVVPFFLNYIDSARNNVRFDKVAGNFPGDGYRCAERWWFA